ncbi:MAG TPA: GNAT family N-acetyltransferase [Ktedonobacterales bacterium]|nr:GNAT family N-acetyltransferase [Ktedonobacterales bacterium]
MSALTEREFLRLHVEACWGISIPPIEHTRVVLPSTTALPPWSLYQANLSRERVTLWRPDVSPEQQADLLQRAQLADVAFDPALGMRREVVLRLSAKPYSHHAPPRPAARLLTAADESVLEAFEAGSATYFLSPQCAPCMGVIVDGRLVSVAHSSRRTIQACELGINTLPEARRQGYAATAVRAWTEAILREGLVPIYSAFAHNIVSLRLAATAGYARVSESVYGPVAETKQ